MVMKINYVFCKMKVKCWTNLRSCNCPSSLASFWRVNHAKLRIGDGFESILYFAKFFTQISCSESNLMLRDGMFSEITQLVFRGTLFSSVLGMHRISTMYKAQCYKYFILGLKEFIVDTYIDAQW